jgi:hypothetical protein
MLKQSLALLVLLLAPAYLQAQTSVDSHYPGSLRGLKGVRLVVKFGRAEAMDKSQRPAVLKLLQSDAEAKLAKAGIPLLVTTGDMENAPGAPQLIVTVTLDKPNGHVFPVVSETRLLQKARLSQDPSIELDVLTWVTRSVGVYDISNLSLLRLQVVNEVDKFIKEYAEANGK